METADMKSLRPFGAAARVRSPRDVLPPPAKLHPPAQDVRARDRSTGRAVCASIDRATPLRPHQSLRRGGDFRRLLGALCGWCIVGAVAVLVLAILGTAAGV